MSPADLAAKGTESGHQKAIFAWAAMATYRGFDAANDPLAYNDQKVSESYGRHNAVPVLAWMHSIPNGGQRDAVTAARMKAEGLRKGVPDIFLPVARWGYHGFYIELKIAKGKESDEQLKFHAALREQGYAVATIVGWEKSVSALQQYLLQSV